jgi:Zn-dependent peptidase ImmA (M78 family)
MGVTVWYPAEVPGLSHSTLKTLLEDDPWSWSAATLEGGDRNLVILNSAHAAGRQSNDLMHELSHLICGHVPAQTQTVAGGILMLVDYDEDQESEADTLAATLLLPRIALVAILSSGMSIESAALKFGVTTELMQMRLNTTGTLIQFRRRTA